MKAIFLTPALMSSVLASAVAVHASVISIDNGRQLFVDDALIAATNGVVRHWNEPTKTGYPIIRPTSSGGRRMGGCACAADGGLWWDPTIDRYRLWYEDDWAGHMRYAESKDGMSWEFPKLDKVPGTSRVFSDSEEKAIGQLDSWSVYPDYKAKDPYSTWNMMISTHEDASRDILLTSKDGRQFAILGCLGRSSDRSTMYFDSILNHWVFSLRSVIKPIGRARRFYSQPDFTVAKGEYRYNYSDAPPWEGVFRHDFGPRGSLYNFIAVPYESLMLGVMEVLHGSPRDNRDGLESGLPKQTSLRFAFSRDGHFYAPAPKSAIRPSGWGSGKWDTGYLSALGGICVIRNEELWFYYSGVRGDAEKCIAKVGDQPEKLQGMYYNGAIGAAKLRRDGFAGLVADGNGEVTTKPVRFSGAHLFVNAECYYGEVAAELLDADGRIIKGYSRADCRGIKYDDTTKRELTFAGGDLSKFSGRDVSFRFVLHCATLYSFWVSPTAHGESLGYVAAGGSAYSGVRDL